ncbi:MAG: carbon storage regulator CsrA [Kineosporiaceae bacterium]
MLVLTRRAGESIVIGDDVRVVVLDVRGDTVRLGIEAPRTVQVHRAEVYAEVQAANAAAAEGGAAADVAALAGRLRGLARGGTGRPAASPVARRGEQRSSGPVEPPAPTQPPAPPAREVPKPHPPRRPGTPPR